MLAEHALVVALEGPSYSGKSTLASCLVDSYAPHAALLPCYVDVAGGDAAVPPAFPADVAAEMAALEQFVAIDDRRWQQQSASIEAGLVVVVDRCWLSLLAHVYALERTGGPDAFEAALALLQTQDMIRPDLVLYLSLSEQDRVARVPDGYHDRWYLDPAFNRQIDRFFREVASDLAGVPIVSLDAGGASDEVCAQAKAAIETQLKQVSR
ncbi:MAG TPA: hypothetical protein VLK58_02780 [Conexibacter sp.]|nr:hypothetical protein [Conexibacter sp.]